MLLERLTIPFKVSGVRSPVLREMEETKYWAVPSFASMGVVSRSQYVVPVGPLSCLKYLQGLRVATDSSKGQGNPDAAQGLVL